MSHEESAASAEFSDSERKLPRPFRISEERVAFCASSCAVLYKSLGLPAVLHYLLEYLKDFYPMTRIFCGFRHYRDVVFIPVADTLPSGRMTTSTRILTNEQIQKLMVKEDFSPYILSEDPISDNSYYILRQKDFIAHLRVPLFKLGDATFQMGFCGAEAGTFQEPDMELFSKLIMPFGKIMRQELEGSLKGDGIKPLGSDSSLLRMCGGLSGLLDEMEKVAETDYTVLITGETGAGKDMVANAIHVCSARHNGPLIKVNCGALTESLLESELFGYEKGAFTGANFARAGYFEAANGGTIFLDEVGELSHRAQVALLRILDNQEILRVGSTRGIPLDIRIIAATNRNLKKMVEEGTFRADLWYRINIFPLRVPPLREHRMDIHFLARYFANNTASKLKLEAAPVIPEEQMEKLFRHDWPGNVRELRNVIERTIIRCRQGSSCLPLTFDFLDSQSSVPQEMVSDSDCPAPFSLLSPQPALPSPENLVPMSAWIDEYLQYVLKITRGKITGQNGAASILEMHPNTVRERRNKLVKQ